jgi:hypothetical protein
MFTHKKIQTNHKVWLCLIGNALTMLMITIFIFVFRDPNSKYFRYGPYDDLIVISIKIDTWIKWAFLLFFVGIIKGCDVLVNELGSPILGFRIYNPDCKKISDFTKNELNFLGNAMWFVNSFRSLLMVVITITQFDIALSAMLMSQLVSIFTVRHLLNDKEFIPKDQYEQNQESDVPLTSYY